MNGSILSRGRFQLALRQLTSDNWARFEKVASTFLSGDFDNIRTTANPAGDRGRDAQLYTTGDPKTLIQYSVTLDWKSKIHDTVKRVQEEFPNAASLVYVTNWEIGAAADDIVTSVRRDKKLHLDIRDQNWFLERMHKDRHRELVAEELAKEVVDPLLAANGLIERRPSPLTSPELRAAFVHIELQQANETSEQGLTKTAFEALVRSALRSTDSSHPMTGEEIGRIIHEILPTHDPVYVSRHLEHALAKLSTRVDGNRLVNRRKRGNLYWLSPDERGRLDEYLIQRDDDEHKLRSELREMVLDYATCEDPTIRLAESEIASLVDRARRVLETFLLGRGEAFLSAVKSGAYGGLGFEDLRDIILKDLDAIPYKSNVPIAVVVDRTIHEIVIHPKEATQAYLRGVVDAYTLLSFMRETADVQGVVTKMFTQGEIWLDTSLILPLFAETLFAEVERQYTHLLLGAKDAGLSLYMTQGVLDEVQHHLTRAEACAGGYQGTWQGPIPFLFAIHTMVGQPHGQFRKWTDQFAGRERPEEDLKEYLEEVFGIQIQTAESEIARLDMELRAHVAEIWNQTHEKRRQDQNTSDLIKIKLANHDTENYLGVIARRKGGDSTFGYSSWLLTLDRTAFSVEQQLREKMIGTPPRSPVMSPDFLSNYLANGPIRRRMSKKRETQLPIVLSKGILEYLSPEVLREAELVRQQAGDLPERQLRRFTRDAMDRARRRAGKLSERGLTALENQAKKVGESLR